MAAFALSASGTLPCGRAPAAQQAVLSSRRAAGESRPRARQGAASAGAAAAAAVAVAAAAARRTAQRRACPRGVRARVARADGRAGGGKEDVLDVAIVGAGVSGLCAAFGLKRDLPNASVMITEARERVGGNITTCTGEGRLWEEGPNSFQPGDDILTTACDVGLQDEIVLADPNSYRFVWWDGRLRPLPASPADAVFGDFLSLPGKIRAGLGAIGFKEPMPEREESVREFVTRNLGEEAFERLIDPFVSGVYAGNPSRLSAEAATGRVQILEKKGGSLVAGAIQLFQERAKEKGSKPPRDPRLPEVKGQTVGSFRHGLKQFADALASHVSAAGAAVRLSWKLSRLEWDSVRQEHVLEYSTPEGPRQVRSRALILTSPSYVTAELLRPLSAPAAAPLEGIFYPRVAAVTVEYPRSAFREPEHGKGVVKGFGQLHPRSQGIRTLGTIYSSSLFPDREPDPEKIMLLHYIGGARDPELYGGIDSLTDDQIVEATHADTVKTMLKASAAMPKVLGVRVWPRAIPQLDVGHAARLQAAQAGLEAAGVKGIFLAGNFVGGVALGRCVEFGLEVAKDVGKFVNEVKAKHA